MVFNKKLTFEGLQYYHSKIKTLFSNVNKSISDETTRATTKENEIANNLSAEITRAKNSEALKAPLASPALTGTPTAPTASAGTNTTQIATTAFSQTAVSNHNSSSTAHTDIRDLIVGLTTRLNTLADSDDTTLDQLSEIVAYIKSNRTLIENVTTNKVNVADIVDNLTSTAKNKPLSAKQGKVLNDLISSLTSVVNTKIDTINGDTYIGTSKSGNTGTITHKDVTRNNTTSTVSPSHGGTFTAVKTVTSDAKGHVTGVDTETVTLPTYGVATSSALGLVKSGTDITVDSSGNVSVNDDSHNHVISNVDGLQSALDGKASSSHSHNYAGSSSAGGSANTALGLSPFTISNIDELDSFLSDNPIMKYAKASSCNIGFVSNDGLVISLPWSSKYGAQIAIDDQSNWMGIRTKNNGTWNSWSKIALVSDIPTSLPASDVYSWAKASSKPSYSWDEITSKPSTFTPASHTHSYAGSSSAGGSATSAVKLDSSAGSATQPVYFSSGKPVACTYTLGKSVPSNAIFTDTWRGIQNNLTSDSTTDSLSAAQGKVLKNLVDGKAPSSHTHSYLPLSGGTVTGATTFNNTVTVKTLVLGTTPSTTVGALWYE